ncbi:MAG TPA: hypothetical protein VHP37_02250 [Burkholderiales bacterium]|nr:hypothetical protein [Burkholderiales bacterium]
MTTARFERFLASLYVDDDLRRRFAADPRACAHAAGLSSEEIEALMNIDTTGLELAARSYAAKRNGVDMRFVGSWRRRFGWMRRRDRSP